MAKMTKEQQKATAAAEANTFDPLPEGWYHARLRNVDASRSGAKGPYWVWEYEIVGLPDGVDRGLKRRLWNNVSLSEASAGIRKATYEAFGAGVDVDTDELLGEVVKVLVGTETQQQGANAGQLRNTVVRLAPKDDDFEIPEELAGASAGGADPEDIFG